jgi:hypothetical protein
MVPTLAVAILQLQQLPQDVLHPRFLPSLSQILDILSEPAASNTAIDAAQQLLSLGLVPVLHARLLRLEPSSPPETFAGSVRSSQAASGGAQSSSQHAAEVPPTPANLTSSSTSPPPGVSTSRVPPRADLEAFCFPLARIVQVMTELLIQCRALANRTSADGEDVVLMTIEQLLSSPEALKVAVHSGMSAEVQEAARAGSAVASVCMAAVSSFFLHVATALCQHAVFRDAASNSWIEELTRQLESFLHLEENLPFLELLCLPPDDCESDCCLAATTWCRPPRDDARPN